MDGSKYVHNNFSIKTQKIPFRFRISENENVYVQGPRVTRYCYYNDLKCRKFFKIFISHYVGDKIRPNLLIAKLRVNFIR